MNMRPENRCDGSGRPLPGASSVHYRLSRALCPRCGKHGVQVRRDGTFAVHSKVAAR